jgi:hypothetical protein
LNLILLYADAPRGANINALTGITSFKNSASRPSEFINWIVPAENNTNNIMHIEFNPNIVISVPDIEYFSDTPMIEVTNVNAAPVAGSSFL